MIKVLIQFGKDKKVYKLQIEGHAPVSDGMSLECASVSILVDTIDIAFTEIFDYNVKIKKKDGYFSLEVKKANEDIEKILAPFIKVFYKLAKQFKEIDFVIQKEKE